MHVLYNRLLGGRKMKWGVVKNHLEDKIYGYELATACVEWEERMRVPLSLLNEAVFEASFICRDELIEAFRSKVALDAERKAVFFKDVANTLVPVRQYRSIMGDMPRHRDRDIIILPCWTKCYKWSHNIRRMLLKRSVVLSYDARIRLCRIGINKDMIKLEIQPSCTGKHFIYPFTRFNNTHVCM